MKKIKFKKPLSVYKTDKIANLLGHEVLRTPVRHCELNPIELIWAHVEESHSYQGNSLSHTPFLFLINGLLPSPKLPL
jgi:hypothetical protein